MLFYLINKVRFTLLPSTNIFHSMACGISASVDYTQSTERKGHPESAAERWHCQNVARQDIAGGRKVRVFGVECGYDNQLYCIYNTTVEFDSVWVNMNDRFWIPPIIAQVDYTTKESGVHHGHGTLGHSFWGGNPRSKPFASCSGRRNPPSPT